MKIITEAAIPQPARIMLVKNRVTKAGKMAMEELFPESFKTHKDATKRAKEYVKTRTQTDYRTDTKQIDTENYGRLIIVFTQFYWYKGDSPEITTLSFTLKGSDVIDVYDYIVDTKVFSQEMTSKYKIKVKPKVSIPISSNNTEEQKKYPRLVEIGKIASNYFRSLPVIEDEPPQGYGNSMSYLTSKADQERLYDYQFFEWNQFFEAEHFAKKYFIQGYDVYIGKTSLKSNSVMLYVLKALKPEPIPIFKKKYFFMPSIPIPVWGKEDIGKVGYINGE
jgi:hypothetical protein